MPLADWFRTFCDNIQVKDDGTISSRYKSITSRLNTDFWTTTSDTAHSFYVGSYGRNTAIEGFSDLDMIFRLPYELYLQYDKHEGKWTICTSSGSPTVFTEDLPLHRCRGGRTSRRDSLHRQDILSGSPCIPQH